jgi:hypothetical protein
MIGWVFYCSYCDDNTTASPCARCGHRTHGYTTEDGSQTPPASDGEAPATESNPQHLQRGEER